jgi:hypothetical protein
VNARIISAINGKPDDEIIYMERLCILPTPNSYHDQDEQPFTNHTLKYGSDKEIKTFFKSIDTTTTATKATGTPRSAMKEEEKKQSA